MSSIKSIRFGFRPSVQLQMQTEKTECGIACLAMIASFHGHRVSLRDLRVRFAASLRGVSLTSLGIMAASLGFTTRAVRLDTDEIEYLQLPCILHWNIQHFVVLTAVSRTGIKISDPAIGDLKINWKETSKRFSGVALELTPALDFKLKAAPPGLRIGQLFGNVIGLNRSLVQVALLAIMIEVFAITSPFFNQWVIDDAIVGNDPDLLLTLAVGFGLLWLLQTATELIRGWAVTFMSVSLNIQWTANVFSHLLKLPVSYFDKRDIGGVISRFGSINAIQSALTTSFVEAILDGLMSAGTLVVMFMYSPTLSLISVAALTAYVLLRISMFPSLRTTNEGQLVTDSILQNHFIETIRGIQTLKLFDQTTQRASEWLNILVGSKNLFLKNQRLMLAFHTGNSILSRMELLLVIYFGASKVMQNQFSIGMFVAFLSYRSQFSQRLSSLVDKFFELKMLRVHAERLADIVFAEPEKQDVNFNITFPISNYALDLLDIGFKFQNEDRYIFKDCNIRIEQGESVAIVGPSGCGKTTLLRLMAGLLSPTDGVISVGGFPIRQISISEYRKMFGTVFQQDTLFAGTISENISFFTDQPDLMRVVECARQAAVAEEIKAMPMGFNTMIGGMGDLLSGGQKQRILLARALYKQPRILFLDEATSHLDDANERLINTAIASLRLTRVIVAHRAETIRTADRVINLVDVCGTPRSGTDLY